MALNFIKKYEGVYEISNLGNVKSLKKIIGRRIVEARLLTQRISAQGYFMVSLTKNYKTFNYNKETVNQ